MQDPNSNLEFSRIAHLLRKFGLKPDEANELTERIGNMASSNIVSRLESKIDAQNTKYNILIWAIGFAGLVISAAIIFSGSI